MVYLFHCLGNYNAKKPNFKQFHYFHILKTSILENLFIIAQQNRKILYQYLKNTPKEALFLVPKGFNNNIWWNIAHVVVTQQKLVYGLSGLPLVIDDALVKKYEKGTYPKGV
ncbi:MAG: DinB family protein, partial [Croceitalea sp.]|nr:DinB family protein [Croceitalea sp.]